jgi:hypothetical protein
LKDRELSLESNQWKLDRLGVKNIKKLPLKEPNLSVLSLKNILSIRVYDVRRSY